MAEFRKLKKKLTVLKYPKQTRNCPTEAQASRGFGQMLQTVWTSASRFRFKHYFLMLMHVNRLTFGPRYILGLKTIQTSLRLFGFDVMIWSGDLLWFIVACWSWVLKPHWETTSSGRTRPTRKCPVVFEQGLLNVSVRLNLKSPLDPHLLEPRPNCSLGCRLFILIPLHWLNKNNSLLDIKTDVRLSLVVWSESTMRPPDRNLPKAGFTSHIHLWKSCRRTPATPPSLKKMIKKTFCLSHSSMDQSNFLAYIFGYAGWHCHLFTFSVEKRFEPYQRHLRTNLHGGLRAFWNVHIVYTAFSLTVDKDSLIVPCWKPSEQTAGGVSCQNSSQQYILTHARNFIIKGLFVWNDLFHSLVSRTVNKLNNCGWYLWVCATRVLHTHYSQRHC